MLKRYSETYNDEISNFGKYLPYFILQCNSMGFRKEALKLFSLVGKFRNGTLCKSYEIIIISFESSVDESHYKSSLIKNITISTNLRLIMSSLSFSRHFRYGHIIACENTNSFLPVVRGLLRKITDIKEKKLLEKYSQENNALSKIGEICQNIIDYYGKKEGFSIKQSNDSNF